MNLRTRVRPRGSSIPAARALLASPLQRSSAGATAAPRSTRSSTHHVPSSSGRRLRTTPSLRRPRQHHRPNTAIQRAPSTPSAPARTARATPRRRSRTATESAVAGNRLRRGRAPPHRAKEGHTEAQEAAAATTAPRHPRGSLYDRSRNSHGNASMCEPVNVSPVTCVSFPRSQLDTPRRREGRRGEAPLG